MTTRTGNAGSASRWVLAFAIIALLAACWFAYDRYFGERPDPDTVVAVSLKGLQEQERLVPFTARYVAVVTSREERLGLSAEKTLILPGTVRYEIDLGLLTQQSLVWNEASRTLDITLPPIQIAGPEFELQAMQEYADGRILLNLTDAEERLDEANRKAARAQLIEQAQADLPMKLAREASIKAVENAFSMPLTAVGIDAKVENVEWGFWLDEVYKKKNYDMTIIAHTSPNDMGNFARGPDYFYGYDNAEMTALWEQITTEVDPAKRDELLKQGQQMLSDQSVHAFLFQLPLLGVFREGVEGYWSSSPVLYMPLKGVSKG